MDLDLDGGRNPVNYGLLVYGIL